MGVRVYQTSSQGRRKAVLERQEMNLEKVKRRGGGKKTERRAGADVREIDQDRLARCQSQGRQHRFSDQEMKRNAQHVHGVAVLRDSSQERPPQHSQSAGLTEMVRR